jgi:hypothetical protein
MAIPVQGNEVLELVVMVLKGAWAKGEVLQSPLNNIVIDKKQCFRKPVNKS